MNNKKKFDVSVLIMVLVVIAVLVLGGFAIAPKVKTVVEVKKQEKMMERIEAGQGTVEDYATLYLGVTPDELIKQTGLSGINKATLMSEVEEKMTLKNFCSVYALDYSDEDVEEFKTFYAENLPEGTEKVEISADTTDITAKQLYASFISEKMNAEMNGEVGADGQIIPTEGEEAPADAEATPAPSEKPIMDGKIN